jgi:glycosyltransferase involved in cell wall biosynthesis
MNVSIIVPTYNRSALLADLLESVINQYLRPIEVVVVDDGSTDDTAEIVQECFTGITGDAGVLYRYERLDISSGAPAARNRGCRLARGEAVMFVDSDDVLLPNGLSDLCERLAAHPEWGYVYGRVGLTDAALVPLAGVRDIGAPFRAGVPEDVAGYHWHTMGALYRRSCIDSVGLWNEELTGSQDWEYQARVKLAGGQGGFVDTCVGYWRQHDFGRVGADSFRPDYVHSAAKACCSIWKHSCHARKGTPLLAKRIARRLLRHALEWGAAGYSESKLACIQRAMHIATCDKRTTSLLKVFKFTPQWVDRLMVQITDARSRIR